jgi:hypothetical protein
VGKLDGTRHRLRGRMDIRVDSLDFSQALSGDGPREASKTIVFPRPVSAAVAGLTGYLAEFSSSNDHHIGKLDMRLSTEVVADVVTVTGRLGLRDWSGNWDDPYDGVIDFVVLADLESATAPPARSDLVITGMELIQATQFFRANQYLDPANAHPNNSIFLIEGKNTGVRVYVDWDSTAGLAPISQLSGQLLVTNAAGGTTLTPINRPPLGSIVPKRDVQINQALADDTLNFMIPASLSTGTVTVTCRVFDAANPAATSDAFVRTLVFTPVQPLNFFLVGVATQQPVAAAPTQAAVAGAFPLLIKTYPRGLIQFTGYTTITLTAPIVGLMANSGCGPGWSSLLDQLRDLRGGSADIYFGGLPAGIFAAGVVGCSPVGDRIAASFIDLPATVPHEVGHSLGLLHDPCRGCSPAVQDPDPNVPQYNTFNSDSIGAFGYDPTTNSVFNPASAFDFMTGSLPAIPWISPYRHQGLLGPTVGGPVPGGGMTLFGGDHMTLFLGLEVDRKRNVSRRTSFHFRAPLQGASRCETPFTYEFLDKERKLLDCGILHCMCSAGCSCWPKIIRDALLFPDGAAFFGVFEDDHSIHEEAIPDPPRVWITGQKPNNEGIELSWQTTGAESYLVHYRDSQGVWRGAATRSPTSSFVVPWRLFGRATTLGVRVLASSGIATGSVEVELKDDNREPPDVSVTVPGVGPVGEGPTPIPPVIEGLAVDAGGVQLSEGQLWWYDGAGNLISRGRQVDLRALPMGQSVVRAVLRGHGGRTVGKAWAIERTDAGFFLRAVMCDPERTASDVPHKHPHPAPPPCEE